MKYAPGFIEAQIKQILAEVLCVNESDLAPDASLREDLGADSLDLASAVIEIDRNFGITITDSEGDAMKTVADVVRIVEQKVNAA